MRKLAVILVVVILFFASSSYVYKAVVNKREGVVLDKFKFGNFTYRVDEDIHPQIIRCDFDGDGRIETLIGFQGRTDDDVGVPASFIAIGREKNGKFNTEIILDGNDRFSAIDLSDIDKDGLYEIVFWSGGGAHHTDLDIYKYSKGKMNRLFRNGSACEVLVENNPYYYRIKIGVDKLDDPKWCYAEGTDTFQVYDWDGNKFAYNKKLRTAKQSD